MRKLIKKILRENELDWIKNEGKERIYIIEKLKKWVKKNNMDADFDLEYDKGYNNEKEVEEYFGKIWFSSDEHYFIELYETKDGFKARFYELFAEENEYLHNWGKSINEPIKSAEDFWRQVAFLIMTYGETTSWDIHKPHTIKESNEWDWVSDTGDNLNKIKVGATFRPTNQYDPTLLIKIHKVEIDEEEPMYRSTVYVRGLGSDGSTFDTSYYLVTFLEWLNDGDLELVPDDFDNFGFPEELLTPPLSESSEFDWIKDQDPNNVHITDLELGQVVMINCPFYSFKNRKFTVDEIRTNLAKLNI